jgi:hypothetical protein
MRSVLRFSRAFCFSRATFLPFACLAAVACSPPWLVVRQAVPDPFFHRPQFKLEPLHFEQAFVGRKPEAEYAAEKQPDQQVSWAEDKRAMSERFGAALATSSDDVQIGSAADAPTIRPIVTFLEPGFYAGVVSAATQVELTVQILDARGQVEDEIALGAVVNAGLINPASGNRVRQAATELGKITAKYLKSRVSPD